MSLILRKLHKIRKDKGEYTTDFWKKVRELSNSNREELSEFILRYLGGTKSNNIVFKDCQMILATVQAVYPFEDSQINELGKSFANIIRELSKISELDKVKNRGHLLYLTMDVILSTGEIIIETEESIQKKLFEAILNVSTLNYDVNDGQGDSYFKNYKIIQFYRYFSKPNWRKEIVKAYLNHFDPRIREDMQYDLDEYGEEE